ncbi:MAG: GIY-YIG nuclease family protein [Actinobacteria bacterium]|nr:GIY-YIG nuclease family protein [Actinomycetota bacterium]
MENRYLANNEMNLLVSEQGKWFVYAIECNNGSVYIGQTKKILDRWKLHQKGKAARWTKKHEPIRLFYYEIVDTFKEALDREKKLKKTSGRRYLKELLKIDSQSGGSAETLLERIKQDKEKFESTSKKRKKI